MGILDLFQSKEKKEKLSHLKRLVALSAADGQVTNQELVAIASICEREGLSANQFEKLVKNPSSIELVQPKDYATKIKYLTDLVYLMMCDGKIDKSEIALCKGAAKEMGLPPTIVYDLSEQLLVEIAEASLL
jgi:uncharacterized tellurite resistance protein B-like protein